ncbi:MAG: DNA repair protein RecO [Elusimicrobia bacterium GWA2_61_42]|nr:MAG: DNA repair protein RecO [Elusimicrobia bacterium GWA2_61_42]OGR74141.1 MAG: DNA repair protein RecO [Elusimicrobia bacterium GWC2_61_25]
MIFCDYGIVLQRRPLRENDRIVTVFTLEHGKLEVNFKSVRLARGKLRALSEAVTWGDYRFYLKKGSNFPVCTGGRTLCVFGGIRTELERLYLAMHYCEVVNRLTPAQSPSPEKYDLLLGALADLDAGGCSFWLRQAFTLRALELAGFGFRETAAGPEAAFWETLHGGSWDEVRELPEDAASAKFIDGLFSRFFSEHIGIDLRTLAFVK